ncbi:MAG: trypsin-like peptidase domain-containing protein [Actinobacteria bacterium]|nr:trypsin-like peptidase domain-containing protein [Actinomycetota bacterium]
MTTHTEEFPAPTEIAVAEPPPAPAGKGTGKKFVAIALTSALLGAGAGASAGLAVSRNRSSGLSVERVAAAAQNTGGATGVAAVAQKVIPSIVRIDVTGPSSPFGAASSGTGSGVIFTSDGYIMTNNHVVDGEQSISVTLSTGEKLAAKLVGTASPADDIAVVKVDKTGLPAATLGSTGDLSVGDMAVAIGSPFGLQGTVTAGVISALHRNIDLGQGEHLTDAIQTDAPINPGNSGGVLADARGEVVGINTAILGGGNGNVGVGFAIPIDIARRDAEQIIATGHAERPFLGISGENIPSGGGALIQEVVAGGPASKAGLRAGDIVTRINSTKITSMDDLIAALSTHRPGDAVRITYARGGSSHTATATLSARATG